MRIFNGHVKPGGVVTGAIVPSRDDMETIVYGLAEDSEAYANLFEIVFNYEEHQEGSVIFHHYLEIMRTLALKAPVCHLVKPHIFPAIQKVIDGEDVIGVLPSIWNHSPMLHRLLRPANGGPADELTKDILQDMVLIAKRAFEVAENQVRRVSSTVVVAAYPLPLTRVSLNNRLNGFARYREKTRTPTRILTRTPTETRIRLLGGPRMSLS